MSKPTKKKKKRIIMIDVVAVGRLGGLARAKNLSAKERSKQARHAAVTRWARSPKTRKETPDRG